MGIDQQVALDILDRVTEGLLLPRDAESGHDGFIQEVGVHRHVDIDDTAATDGDLLGLQTDAGDDEGRVGGAGDGVITVQVGRDTVGGAFDNDAGSDDGFAGIVLDRSLDRNVLRIHAQGEEQSCQGENKVFFKHYNSVFGLVDMIVYDEISGGFSKICQK